MNAILKRAIDAVQALPESQQAEVAEEMLAYVGLIQQDTPGLSDERVVSVKAAQSAVQAGEIARAAEIEAVWRTFGQ